MKNSIFRIIIFLLAFLSKSIISYSKEIDLNVLQNDPRFDVKITCDEDKYTNPLVTIKITNKTSDEYLFLFECTFTSGSGETITTKKGQRSTEGQYLLNIFSLDDEFKGMKLDIEKPPADLLKAATEKTQVVFVYGGNYVSWYFEAERNMETKKLVSPPHASYRLTSVYNLTKNRRDKEAQMAKFKIDQQRQKYAESKLKQDSEQQSIKESQNSGQNGIGNSSSSTSIQKNGSSESASQSNYSSSQQNQSASSTQTFQNQYNQEQRDKVSNDYTNEGNALSRQGNFAAAIDKYNQALRENPNNETARKNIDIVNQYIANKQDTERKNAEILENAKRQNDQFQKTMKTAEVQREQLVNNISNQLERDFARQREYELRERERLRLASIYQDEVNLKAQEIINKYSSLANKGDDYAIEKVWNALRKQDATPHSKYLEEKYDKFDSEFCKKQLISNYKIEISNFKYYHDDLVGKIVAWSIPMAAMIIGGVYVVNTQPEQAVIGYMSVGLGCILAIRPITYAIELNRDYNSNDPKLLNNRKRLQELSSK